MTMLDSTDAGMLRSGGLQGPAFPIQRGTLETLDRPGSLTGTRPVRVVREASASVQPQRVPSLRRRRCRAAILDVEGTLLDSTEARVLSWFVALHDCGHDVSLDLLRTVIGMGTGEFLPIVAGTRASSDGGQRIILRQAEIFRTWYLPRLLPFDGTRRLLQRMTRDGLRLVALVGHGGESATSLLEAAGIADLLAKTDVVGTDMSVTTQADMLEAALQRLGDERESVIFLADSPYDISSAQSFGIAVVALRCGGWSDEALAGAAAVYQDPADLHAQYSSSPFCYRPDRLHGPVDLALTQ